jgi:hypothetical protein
VILPNFDFGFFSFNGQNLELTKTQKKSLEVCLEQGWSTRFGLWAAFEKKIEQNSKHRKITEFRRRNFFLDRGLATFGLEAEKAIFSVKKSSN